LQLKDAEQLLRAYQIKVEESYRRDGLLPAKEAVWEESSERHHPL
jgi:hypothetical protein